MRRPIHVEIVDPHAGVRNALRALLESEPDLRVTALATMAALAAVERLDVVDVVVADERIVGASPSHARSLLTDVARRAPVVVTGLDDPGQYAEAVIAAGAV